MVPNDIRRSPEINLLSPICLDLKESSSLNDTNMNMTAINETTDLSMVPYSIKDITCWVGGNPESNLKEILNEEAEMEKKKQIERGPSVKENHADLDEVLAKLQQILANNFILDGK